jgi:hypothetical protein
MRKPVFICISSVFLLFTSAPVFSQVTEMALLSSGNVTDALQYNLMESPTEGLSLLIVPEFSWAHSDPGEPVTSVAVPDECKAEAELAAMQLAIIQFFTAMEGGKIDQLKEACTPAVSFKTHLQDQMGNHHILEESIQDLVPFVAKSGNCFNIDVRYELLPPDPSSMQFRAPYMFYVNDQISHCGVCTFELEKTGNDWKIKQMIDTRSRSCK